MTLPLAGIRVLDLSRLLPGPFLTGVLGGLGAEVVKLEQPGVGDEMRLVGPELDGAGFAYTAVNRGKRCIAVDLKRPEGRAIALRLALASDVLVESFRPGVMDRLGLTDAALAEANPRLVRCSLLGYGPGDYRDDPGHDLNYQALAGILPLANAADPLPPPTPVADLAGALYAASAILAALLARERTGAGGRVEVALADAALAMNALPLASARAAAQRAGGDEAARAWELTGGAPCYRVYRCADGRHVALAALEPKFWDRFCAATGTDASIQFDAAREAHAAMESLFAARSASEWVGTLRKAGVPITPVLAPAEVPVAPGPAYPLAWADERGHPPALGEHTDEVLLEAGYPRAEIARLRTERVVE